MKPEIEISGETYYSLRQAKNILGALSKTGIPYRDIRGGCMHKREAGIYHLVKMGVLPEHIGRMQIVADDEDPKLQIPFLLRDEYSDIIFKEKGYEPQRFKRSLVTWDYHTEATLKIFDETVNRPINIILNPAHEDAPIAVVSLARKIAGKKDVLIAEGSIIEERPALKIDYMTDEQVSRIIRDIRENPKEYDFAHSEESELFLKAVLQDPSLTREKFSKLVAYNIDVDDVIFARVFNRPILNADQRLVSGQPFNPTHYDEMPRWHRLSEARANAQYEVFEEAMRDSVKFLRHIDAIIKERGAKKV